MLLRDKYPDLQFSLFVFPTQLIDNLSTISPALIMGLLKTGAIIAIIAIVETIVSAKIATKMTKIPFDKDQEVTGLGITNLL